MKGTTPLVKPQLNCFCPSFQVLGKQHPDRANVSVCVIIWQGFAAKNQNG
jgi:hypothetical protein